MKLPAGEAHLPHDQVQVPIKVEAEVLQCVGLPMLVAPLLLLEQEDQKLVADALNQPNWLVVAQGLAAGGKLKRRLASWGVLGGCSQTKGVWPVSEACP